MMTDSPPAFPTPPTFVWPYWHAGASYDELRWSMRSVRRFFRASDPEIGTEDAAAGMLLVGDLPILRGRAESWYNGPHLAVRRIVRGRSFSAKLTDALNKWRTAIFDDKIGQTLVWMMDDVYFVRPFTIRTLAVPRKYKTWTPDRLKHWRPTTGFQAAKRNSLLALAERGLPLHDFATHLPHVVDRDRARRLWTEFDLEHRPLLWEVLYENMYLSQRPIGASPLLRYFPRPQDMRNILQGAKRATVFVTGGAAWNESMRLFLWRQLPDRTEFETDQAVAPAGAELSDSVEQLSPTVSAGFAAVGAPALTTARPCGRGRHGRRGRGPARARRRHVARLSKSPRVSSHSPSSFSLQPSAFSLPPASRLPSRPESTWTPWGDGWHAPNGKAPEYEFIDFIASLARLHRPRVVIETGAGGGSITRALVPVVKSIPDSLYVAFESDPRWRRRLDVCGCLVSNLVSPTDQQIAGADLVILDSEYQHRVQEIARWNFYGKPGSALIVHDVSDRHAPEKVHWRLWRSIMASGLHGAMLLNPRGGFIATKSPRAVPRLVSDDGTKVYFRDLLYIP